MRNVGNQKIVKININVSFPKNGSEATEYEIYGKVNKQCAFKAMKELTPSAYSIYMYMALQADGWEFALSPVAIDNAIGVKRTAYISAIKELIEKNYLIHSGKNRYCFVVDNEEGKVSEIRSEVQERNVADHNMTQGNEECGTKRQIKAEESVGMCDRKITLYTTYNNTTEDKSCLKKYLIDVGVCDELFNCEIDFKISIKDIVAVHKEDFIGIYNMCCKNTKFANIYPVFPKVSHRVVFAINQICREIKEYYRTHYRIAEKMEVEQKERRKKAYRHAQFNEYYTKNGDVDVERAYLELFETESISRQDETTQKNEQDDELRRVEEYEKYSMFIGLKWDDSDEAM